MTNSYIKKNTGYDIDIFEEYKTDVMHVLKKGKIDHNDVYFVENYLKAYDANPDQQKNTTLLKELLTKYENDLAEVLKSAGPVEVIYGMACGNKSWQGNEAEYKEKLKEFNKDWLLAEELSPNGIDKLNVQFNGKGENALTYVVILLENAGSGTIYCARGEKLPIKAYWKDNHTVIIETKSTYQYHDKCQQVRSYGEVFKIEYIEV